MLESDLHLNDRLVTDRIQRATISLVLDVGVRRLRTADIAKRAHTTESTMFRHFSGGLDDILRQSYNRAWAIVNQRVSQFSFDHPHQDTATQLLLRDMQAIWSFRDDAELSEIATFAFLFLRRHHEILSDDVPAEEQRRFEARIQQLCSLVIGERWHNTDAAPRSPELLRELLLNYASTVWLTWFCMPIGSRDVTVDHDLTADEAQLGVLVLLERFGSAVPTNHEGS